MDSLEVTILVNNKGNIYESPVISVKGLPIDEP